MISKSTIFSGQPILNQQLMFLDKGQIKKISKVLEGDGYVKKFTTYNHVVMLFISPEGYSSIRELNCWFIAHSYLSFPLSKNFQFSMWDLKQKHFKFFYIFNYKYAKV